jgi:hypothetical protein
MVRTDIFRRGVPWMLLIKRTGTMETDLNVNANQKVCVALTGLTLLAALCGIAIPGAAIGAGLGLTAIVALNGPFFAFLGRRRGWVFASAALPLHLLYYCCCGLSVAIALVYWRLKRPETAPARSDRTERADRATVWMPHLAAERRASRSARGRPKSA